MEHFNNEIKKTFGTYAPVHISFASTNGDIIKEINTLTTALLNESDLPEKTDAVHISAILKAPEKGKFTIYMLADGKINFFIDDILIKTEKKINGTDLFLLNLDRGFHILKAEIKDPETPNFIICWKTPSKTAGYISPKYLLPYKS